jgi:putative membrane protein
MDVPEAQPDPRVILAAERTLLAWMRTGLALMGFGFVVARFGWFLREMAAVGDHEPDPGTTASLWIGTGLVALGIWVLIGSTVRYRQYLRSLQQGDRIIPGPGLGTAVSLILATLGLGMVAYLVLMGLRS